MQRSLISLGVGVVLAIAAIIALNYYLAGSRAAPTPVVTIPVGTVVVAAADLPIGTDLRPDLLKVVSWPQNAIPAGSFQTVESIFANTDKPGERVVIRAMDRDEAVLHSKITGFGGRATLSRVVSDGMRAVSIRVDDVSGVAGFMLPGDHVDILLTRRISDAGGDRLVTDTILQNVTILGIDQFSDQARDQPVVARTATVEVNPQQAQKLVLAQEAGTLRLALRNVSTGDQVPTATTETKDLSPASAQAVAPKARSTGHAVRIVYGDGTTVIRSVH